MKKNVTNYYKILGIAENASIDEIRRAYRFLVLTKHPDVNKSENACEEFMQIIKAYNVLKDENKRKEYDSLLESQSSFFNKINFKYMCDKVVSKSDSVLKKLSKAVKSITTLSNAQYDLSQFQTAVDIPPEVMAMSQMSTNELEMRLQVSDNQFVRAYSAFALGVKGDKNALHSLELALKDSELLVRQKSVWAIGKLKMKKSLPLLQTLFENSGRVMKEEILKAVYEITGGHGKVFKDMINYQNNGSVNQCSIKYEQISAENKMVKV